jgi:hypothetical protein
VALLCALARNPSVCDRGFADALPEGVTYVGCFSAGSPAALLPQSLGYVFSIMACAERARQAGLRWALGTAASQPVARSCAAVASMA